MAISVKSGTFTAPAATGNQSVTWTLGGTWPANATPELVILFSTGQTSAGVGASAFSVVGAFNATQQCTFASYADGPALTGANTIATSNTGQSTRTTACVVILSNGTPTILSVASAGATRFQQNGFNLNWTTVGAGTTGMIFGYIAFAGLSETWVGALRSATAAGAQTTPVLGSGAQWDAGIFIPTWHSTGAGVLTDGTTEQTFSRSGIGFAARTAGGIQQYANIYHDNDGETAMDLTLGNSASLCLIMPANATNATASPPRASLTAFNTDGTLTFSWTNVSNTTNKAFLGILLRGVTANVGVTLQPNVATANTDVTVSSLAAQPKALLLTSSGQTTEAIGVSLMPDNGTAQWTFGVSDTTTHTALNNFNQDAAADSEARRVWTTGAVINPYKYTAASPAAGSSPTANASAGSAVVQAVTSSSFTLRWNGQDASQRRIGYVILGDAVTATNATLTASTTTATTSSGQSTLTAGASLVTVTTTASTSSASATPTATVNILGSTTTATTSSGTANITSPVILPAGATTASTSSPSTTLLSTVNLAATTTTGTAASATSTLRVDGGISGTTTTASASGPSSAFKAGSTLPGNQTTGNASSPGAALLASALIQALGTTTTSSSPASALKSNVQVGAGATSGAATSSNATIIVSNVILAGPTTANTSGPVSTYRADSTILASTTSVTTNASSAVYQAGVRLSGALGAGTASTSNATIASALGILANTGIANATSAPVIAQASGVLQGNTSTGTSSSPLSTFTSASRVLAGLPQSTTSVPPGTVRAASTVLADLGTGSIITSPGSVSAGVQLFSALTRANVQMPVATVQSGVSPTLVGTEWGTGAFKARGGTWGTSRKRGVWHG